ncbi:MAG TPA: PAS domain S-box protein [Caulobacteraceae bacterium]|nr:PAS domain S-box protein [Caulobacteraceae bacterium]
MGAGPSGTQAVSPSIEEARLAALARLEILDTVAELQFDNLVKLVARAFDAPMAALALIGADRVWFKARFGLGLAQTPRDSGFWNRLVEAREAFAVPDAAQDPKLAACPLVAGAAAVRFAAAAPLTAVGGQVIGALCIFDDRPREGFGPSELRDLASLADGAMQALEARAEARHASQSDQRVSEQDAILAHAERTSQIGTWVFHVADGLFQGSPQAYRIFGRDPDGPPLRADEVLAFYHPDDARRIVQLRETALRTGVGYEHQVELRRPDGAVRQVLTTTACRLDETGAVVALYGTVQDVTDLKLADAALRASEAQRRLLTDHSMDLILQCDPEGVIVFASASARRWGYEPEALVGRPATDFIHPDDRANATYWFAARAAGEIDDEEGRGELRTRTASGEWVWLDSHSSTIFDADGRPSGLVIVLRDITEARAARLAVAESEAQHRVITEAATDIIIRYDLKGRIEFVSPAVARYGFETTELIGRSLSDFLDPAEIERNADFLSDLAAGRPLPVADQNVWRSRDAHGGSVWFEGVTSPIRDADGKVVGAMAVLRDVSERRAHEEALAASEARYRLLAENATDVIATFDLDGRITYVTPSVERVFGYTAAEMIGSHPARVIHPDDYAMIEARLGELLAGKTPTPTIRYEYRGIKKSGEVIWIEANPALVRDPDTGRIVGLQDCLRDVTDQRAAEAALAKSEAQYRLLAENATDVIASCGLDGRITYVSPSAEKLYGYSTAELVGMEATRLIHPDDLAMVQGRLRDLVRLKTPGATTRYEYRAIDKAGKVIWLEANPSIVCDPQTGQVVALQDCLRDISERKAMEAELARKRAEAEAGAVAKAEFLSNMSHELRTPLTGIIGFGGLLQGMGGLPDKARLYVDRVVKGGEALLAIVNDILDFTKLEAGHVELDPQPFDPRVLAGEAVGMVQVQATQKGLALRTEIDGPLPSMVTADAARVRQVLLNLLSNAIKFTARGKVVLRVRHEAEGGGRLAFEVADTGIGIPEALKHRLFQRFSQVDGSISREFGGTGLGLAICKGLVEMMGGEIGVESTEGAGSTFRFTVAAPAAETAWTPPVGAIEEQGPAPLTFLVVDDVALNRELLLAMLAPTGARIAEAADGAEAVAACVKTRFDLILMDLQMPGMDGYAATRAIRANSDLNRATPVVAISANVLPQHVAACQEAGMNDYLAKPIDQNALMAKVAQYAPKPADAA